MQSYYDDYKKYPDYNKCCQPCHTQPKKIILECGNCPKDAEFEICDDEVKRGQCFVLDKVVTDTTCLYNPVTKLIFQV